MTTSTMTASESARLSKVRAMMCDITGDDEWLAVEDEGLARWLDLGPSWAPSTSTTRELCEQLLDQSVQPCHC